MNLTEEENLAGVDLLIDIGFATYSLLLCSEFDKVSSITVKNAEQCMKSV